MVVVAERYQNSHGLTIQIDRKAVRGGEPIAGWIVLFEWWDPETGHIKGFDATSEFFTDLDAAKERVNYFTVGYGVTLKALRAQDR